MDAQPRRDALQSELPAAVRRRNSSLKVGFVRSRTHHAPKRTVNPSAGNPRRRLWVCGPAAERRRKWKPFPSAPATVEIEAG